MFQSNKIVSNIYLLSIFLSFSYSAHANVAYMDMDDSTPRSEPQDVNLVDSTTLQTNKMVARFPTRLDTIIEHNARKYDVPSELIKAVIRQESNFNNAAVSPKGARGLMQVMPSTAADYGSYNLHAPHHNVEVGSRHLARLLQKYKLPVALAAYNAGEGNISKYGGIPPFRETQNYVLNVLKYYNVELDKQINNTAAISNTTNLTSVDNSSPAFVDSENTTNSEKPTNRNPVLYLSINR